VLFSNDNVAAYVNRCFEPVWESLRPVPLIRIDFGNGTCLTRTLHGNIATYACSAEGRVLDVLPGIYTPEVYLERLYQFRLLDNYVNQAAPAQREARLRDYQNGQAAALARREPPPVFINTGGISKMAIEWRLVAALVPAGAALPEEPAIRVMKSAPGAKPPLPEGVDRLNWDNLVADTRQNETSRRRMVHEILATLGLVRPEQVTRRLYKEVLHADLDDPYLGLGSALFAEYPFTREDQGSH
jgi:hypothetical protein